MPRSHITANSWINYLNRLDLSDGLPISFQGGEPSLHPEFYQILRGIREGLHIDLLTNLSFDVERFVQEIPAGRFLRKAPYPSIRVTYHPGQVDLDKLLSKILFLRDHQYPIGLYSIRIPGCERITENVGKRAKSLGIDYRTKEFLGYWRGKVWGTYNYEQGIFTYRTDQLVKVSCRTTELLIAPDGEIFSCHRDLYLNENGIGNISSGNYRPQYEFRVCDKFGQCNPCDLKRKTDRFQVDGHSSVEIRRD